MSNERKGGLYIDLLMTVRYSHEAWEGHICSVNSHEAWKGCVCSVNSHSRVFWRRRISSMVTYVKNDSVLMPKGEFKLAPNLARFSEGRRARVRGEPSMS